jgi:acyl-CoA thioesterase I
MLARRLLAAMLLLAVFAVGATARAQDDAQPPVLLVVGDSISAGYGLAAGSGWVDLLSAKLKAGHYRYRVVNASITGDTTAGGRARLPELLTRHRPAIVVVELGGNDGLRGGNLAATRDNLDAIIGAIKKAGAKPLLIGMRLPPNYGAAYVREFNAMYTTLAAAQKVPLVPFLFEGFGEKDEMFQSDRVHPAPAAQERMLVNVWPVLQPMLGGAR